ncbi:AAA family ATPase [Streptomyces sp. NPDC051954]|uniref:AAA family ATPase n=1 Tax=Streptomyces sp. NPDC051954 TaxID=3155524 RepID=UPI003437C363
MKTDDEPACPAPSPVTADHCGVNRKPDGASLSSVKATGAAHRPRRRRIPNTAPRFRSCEQVRIPLRPEVTILVGENNAGKSSVIDAMRLLTDPLDGRRVRYFEEADALKSAAELGGPGLQMDVADIGLKQSGAARIWRRCCLAETPSGCRAQAFRSRAILPRGVVCGMSTCQHYAMRSRSWPRPAVTGCE